jgi:hypothetical protein
MNLCDADACLSSLGIIYKYNDNRISPCTGRVYVHVCYKFNRIFVSKKIQSSKTQSSTLHFKTKKTLSLTVNAKVFRFLYTASKGVPISIAIFWRNLTFIPTVLRFICEHVLNCFLPLLLITITCFKDDFLKYIYEVDHYCSFNVPVNGLPYYDLSNININWAFKLHKDSLLDPVCVLPRPWGSILNLKSALK